MQRDPRLHVSTWRISRYRVYPYQIRQWKPWMCRMWSRIIKWFNEKKLSKHQNNNHPHSEGKDPEYFQDKADYLKSRAPMKMDDLVRKM